MAGKAENSIKEELAKRAESAKGETKLTISMGILLFPQSKNSMQF